MKQQNVRKVLLSRASAPCARGVALLLICVVLSACVEIKQSGRVVGHTARDVSREIGHGSRDIAREVSKGAKRIFQSAPEETP